jgi:hypothetical protein
MSENRYNAFPTIKNTGLNVTFVDKNNLERWIVKGSPLHPSYRFLSAVHKADYLRSYLMHNYGGAYTDIKVIEDSWLPSFKKLNNSDYLISGYKESFLGAARGRGFVKDIWLAFNYNRLIGNGAYICKPNTIFTKDWISNIHKILDYKYELLKKYPAKHPRDFLTKKLDDGSVSKYPLRWSEICGGVFHPVCLKYHKRILQDLPAPNFKLPYL